MHSHHSHSGDYVQHAKDHLDEMVQEAVNQRLQVFCLTEHMPRLDPDHLYPEELESKTTVEDLQTTFDNYVAHARRLQKSRSDIELIVGMEAEYIDERYIGYAAQLKEKHNLDMVVGSVHYTNSIPIDFSYDLWVKARASVASVPEDETQSTIDLLCHYFDDQHKMLTQYKPDVVGHFDLILLLAPKQYHSLILEKPVMSRIERNINSIVDQGALVEINSAAIRKGWPTPYPGATIFDIMVDRGVRFCLSDDSHAIDQVGLNYSIVASFLKTTKLQELYYLTKKDGKLNHATTSIDKFLQWAEKSTKTTIRHP